MCLCNNNTFSVYAESNPENAIVVTPEYDANKSLYVVKITNIKLDDVNKEYVFKVLPSDETTEGFEVHYNVCRYLYNVMVYNVKEAKKIAIELYNFV